MTQPATAKPIVPLLAYQRADVECTARFRWNCWARQTGKSFTKSLRRILRGIARRRNQIFLSAGERQSRELMEKARAHCQALSIATQFHDGDAFGDMSVKHLEISLPNGVRIIGLPANPSTARGFTGDVFLDEFAMHAMDREIWAAMFPTLLRGDGELDIASTPKGCSNMFAQLRRNAMFSTHTLSLPEAIAQGLDADAEEMRRAMDDDALYRQEFLCEFLDESTAFLTYQQIAACTDHSLIVQRDVLALGGESRELFAGVDIGRRRDLTVIWVIAVNESQLPIANCQLPIGKEDGNERDLSTSRGAELDCGVAQEWQPVRPLIGNWQSTIGNTFSTVAMIELCNESFTNQFDRLCELLSLPQLRRCCIDSGGLGMQLAEQTAEKFGNHRVEPVIFTPALKSQLAGALRIAVEQRRISIPDDERTRRDWHSVERTITEAGHFRLSAPRREGSHADRFWAAALALHAAGSAAPARIEQLTVRPLNFARSGTW